METTNGGDGEEQKHAASDDKSNEDAKTAQAPAEGTERSV